MSSEIIITLVHFLTGGFLIFLALTITRDDFRNRLNRVAGAMLFFAGLGPVFLAIELIIDPTGSASAPFRSTAWYQLHNVWELFFPTLVLFAWVFPVDQLRDFRRTRMRALVFVPQLMHLVIVLFFSDINRLLDKVKLGAADEGFATLLLKPFSYLLTYVLLLIGFIRSYEQPIFDTINVLYVLIAVYFLEIGARYLKEPRLIRQTRVVLWSLRLGLGFWVISVITSSLLKRTVPDEFNALLLAGGSFLGAVTIAYAIIRFQFLDVQLIFRQSFIYTITSALLVGLYIVLGVRAKEMLTPMFGERAEMLSYVMVIFVLLLFQPISSWVDNVIRSMFLRTRSDYRSVIERFSRQVISMFDPRQLRRTIEETLKTSLLVERVYFVLYDDGIGEYTFLPSDDNPDKIVIDREDLMLRGINLLEAPTQYDSLSNYEDGSKLAGLLKEYKVKLILPMKDANHLLGFLALTAKAAGYRYSAEDFNLLGVLSNQMVTALTNARLYVESLERIRLQEEVSMARQIQLDLLPSEPPELPFSTIYAQSIPSRTVGGDFYDFIRVAGNGGLGVVIADASGKGMPAALMMAQIQAMIHSEIGNGTDIRRMMSNMNRRIVQSTSAEKYVTLFYGELDPSSGRFNYCNAGHNYPILIRANGTVELLEIGGPIIGAFANLEYQSATVSLCPDDLLFFFTDGLSEAMNADGQEYGEERIRQFIIQWRNESPHHLVDSLLADMRAFDPTWPPQDDTTIIALRMNSVGVTVNG